MKSILIFFYLNERYFMLCGRVNINRLMEIRLNLVWKANVLAIFDALSTSIKGIKKSASRKKLILSRGLFQFGNFDDSADFEFAMTVDAGQSLLCFVEEGNPCIVGIAFAGCPVLSFQGVAID